MTSEKIKEVLRSDMDVHIYILTVIPTLPHRRIMVKYQYPDMIICLQINPVLIVILSHQRMCQYCHCLLMALHEFSFSPI